ncbi:putative sulfate exporter family transporter [Nonomuraea sp. NN258]|uniref:YeiH family protein n=1 Tax=Nonomuraea antri TaxID=2730852 RepID=UPI001569846D|nr:putative sulfate exporter family transporter [Nonomuraea antri]NRQ38068.1 putative sulfate exporter family transporter [Nonomuraea antri]
MPYSDRLPGLAASAVAVGFALAVNRFVPALSPAVIAVIAGAALANLAGARLDRLRPGLAFVSRRVLRVAIVLLGLQIAVPQVLALGWQTLVIVTAATGLTFAVTPVLGRGLGLSRGSSLLVATGVSICGAAAIAAMHDSSPDSTDDDAAGALSAVVLYGSASIVVVPLLASWLGLSAAQLGVWTGAAVHEVAQVAAIGAASGVLVSAVTVKLARVVLLAPLVALTAVRGRRASAPPARVRVLAHAAQGPGGVAVLDDALREGGDDPAARQEAGTARRPPILPLFVAGFLAMVALRSTGWVPAPVTAAVPQVTNVLMAAALFGLGTGIDVRRLARSGGRVMVLGAVATALIAGVSLIGVIVLV